MFCFLFALFPLANDYFLCWVGNWKFYANCFWSILMNKWVEATVPGTCLYRTWCLWSHLLEETLVWKPNCTIGYREQISIHRRNSIQSFTRGTRKDGGRKLAQKHATSLFWRCRHSLRYGSCLDSHLIVRDLQILYLNARNAWKPKKEKKENHIWVLSECSLRRRQGCPVVVTCFLQLASLLWNILCC